MKPDGGFKFDVKQIKSARETALRNNMKQVSEADQAFFDGVKLLEEFQKSKDPDSQLLKNAADKLFDSLKRKSNNPEAFVLIAYVFYMFGDDKEALKYSKLARMMDPESIMANKFRDFLSASLPVNEIKRVTGPLPQNTVRSGETKISQSNTPTRASPPSKPLQSVQRINRIPKN